MRRGIVLGVLLLVAGLSMAAAGYQGQAQAGLAPAALAATQIEKVKDNLYIIAGSSTSPREAFSGGNTAVFITNSGVVVVDTKLAGWGQVILDRIKTVTNKPVTTIINTHTHGDHTGGNSAFGATVDIVAHENTKSNMEKMDAFKGENASFLPKRTYKDKLTLGGGKDRIDLYYFGRGHTNGDAWVVFPALRTLHAGDMFARKALPLIDGNNGGSAVEYGHSLQKAHDGIKDVDAIITGHGTLMKWADLRTHADFTKDFVKWALAEIKAGKSVDEAAAEYKVPEKYKDYSSDPPAFGGGMKGMIQRTYDELKK